MPLSLEIIEAKLNKGGFRNLAELESYFKRMISNAKEFYPRGSPVFDDAERIRKATSNYMTKTNPAYNNRKYQALPAPIPAEAGEAGQEAEEKQNQGRNGDAEAEEEKDDDEEEEEEEDKDAEAEEHHEDEPEPEPEPEPEEEEEPARRGRSIILKRSRPARGSRTSTSQVQESPRTSAPPTRPDHKYDGVPYKGLNFQQAQEKIVEEAIRYQPAEYVLSPHCLGKRLLTCAAMMMLTTSPLLTSLPVLSKITTASSLNHWRSESYRKWCMASKGEMMCQGLVSSRRGLHLRRRPSSSGQMRTSTTRKTVIFTR